MTLTIQTAEDESRQLKLTIEVDEPRVQKAMQQKARELSRDIQLQALMEIWLYFHVPLSLGLLGALTAHVVAVFFYW